MLRDLQLAVRMMRQSKGWTAVILISLALGIGANTALFSAMNGLLFRKLPVSDPDKLVRFGSAGPNQMRTDTLVYGFMAPDARGRRVDPTFSYPMYQQLVEANRTMSDLFACAPIGNVNVIVKGQAEIASAFLASGNYYRALGVTARVGRTIMPDDDRPDAAPVAVISHKYWKTRFGGRPDVIGSFARVNNAPVTIVGVLPPEFTGVQQAVDEAPDISVPMALEPQVAPPRSSLQPSLLGAPNFWWVQMMGRLKPGVTAAQVQGNLAGVFQHSARADYDAFLSTRSSEEQSLFSPKDPSAIPELLVSSGSRGIYDVTVSEFRAVMILTAIVVLVLLIVCANVANLLLSRAMARRTEISVRLALGATRGRLVRQLLTESLLLSAIGGGLGLLVARWGQPILQSVTEQTSPFDWRVLAFLVAVSTTTGVVFGIAPALGATRAEVNSGLKMNSRTVGRSSSRLGKSLVVAQVTISLVLLVGAGLFLRTVQNLRRVDIGFNPHNMLLFQINPALNGYDAERRNPLYVAIEARLRALGGVRSVAWSNPSLMSPRRFSSSIYIQGRAYPQRQGDPISGANVSPSFLDTMEIPLAAGHGFTERDTKNAPSVAVINEAAARLYFPKESALGRRFGRTLRESGQIEIVGIARDAKYNNVRETVPPTMYTPYQQGYSGSVTFEVRTAGDPLAAIPAVREAVRAVDPNVPIINLTTQQAEVENRFQQERLFAQAGTVFGGLALLVASVGLFGLMSYSVARRTNEIGIRMALGAARADVLQLVMRESMILVLAGVLLGLAGAIAAGRPIANLLFGLAPADPMTIAAAIVVMLLLSSVAAYLPARRASRVDPIVALRYE
jgi:predicted permease